MSPKSKWGLRGCYLVADLLLPLPVLYLYFFPAIMVNDLTANGWKNQLFKLGLLGSMKFLMWSLPVLGFLIWWRYRVQHPWFYESWLGLVLVASSFVQYAVPGAASAWDAPLFSIVLGFVWLFAITEVWLTPAPITTT